MPRTADKTDIPRRLTEAGYALFCQAGYNATGIQQITDKAGVPKGSFYNHFDSKEAFAALIVRHYAGMVDDTWTACMQDAPGQALPALHHLFARFIKHHEQAACPGCLVGNFAAEVSESSPECRAVLSDVMRTWSQRLADLIESAQAEGSVRQDIPAKKLAAVFWDTWEGALLRMKLSHNAKPLKDAVSLMFDTFFKP